MISQECPQEREIMDIDLNIDNKWMISVKVHQREEIEWKMNKNKVKDPKNILV